MTAPETKPTGSVLFGTDIGELDNSHRRPHGNCYWVRAGQLLAGEYPGTYPAKLARQRIQAHVTAGINCFVDLTHPNDALEPYAHYLQAAALRTATNVSYHALPVFDMGVPTPEQMVVILDTIDHALAQGQVIYLHCWGGIGRTGTVVGCHLVRHGLTGDAALAQIAAWWQTVEKSVRSPHSPETRAQITMVQQWRE